MGIKKEEIKHVAELARIDLSPEELDKYGSQLDSILSYIDQLRKVNTKNVSINIQANEINNIWREDDIKEWDKDEIKTALDQGEIEGGHIKVKKVLNI